ncbi:hypothetical protein BC832DRAFT_610323 [Gaertneriomyces semiglobifer]|nr:hypothetical protein BC832DRAFT_610323 [Gaertneriomyces semiglobifer]
MFIPAEIIIYISLYAHRPDLPGILGYSEDVQETVNRLLTKPFHTKLTSLLSYHFSEAIGDHADHYLRLATCPNKLARDAYSRFLLSKENVDHFYQSPGDGLLVNVCWARSPDWETEDVEQVQVYFTTWKMSYEFVGVVCPDLRVWCCELPEMNKELLAKRRLLV